MSHSDEFPEVEVSTEELTLITERIMEQSKVLKKTLEDICKKLQKGKDLEASYKELKKSMKAATEENKYLEKQVERLRRDVEKKIHVKQKQEEERVKITRASNIIQSLRTVTDALQSKLQHLNEMEEDVSFFKSKKRILEQENQALQSQLETLQKKTAPKAQLEPGLKKDYEEFQALKLEIEELRQNVQELRNKKEEKKRMEENYPSTEWLQLIDRKAQLEKEISDLRKILGREEKEREVELRN